MQSISPGSVETELRDASVIGSNIKWDEQLEKQLKDRAFLKSKDVADAVIYVLSTPPHVQVHELIIKPLGEFN